MTQLFLYWRRDNIEGDVEFTSNQEPTKYQIGANFVKEIHCIFVIKNNK